MRAPVKAVTKGPNHHFFGYYDKCPWSTSGRYMLTMEVPFMDHFPENEPAGIGLIDLTHNGKFNILAQTHAWNWQQGAMLQWLPSAPNRKVIYNDNKNNEYISVILEVVKGKKTMLPRPVAAVNHTGKLALSINFARLYDTRKDYGYSGIADPWKHELHPKEDGIYLMDLSSHKYKLIMSLNQIARFEPETSLPGVKHWVNHVAFNSDDTRFCFLHRFEIPELKRFGTRLFTADLDGSNRRCLWSNHVSHFDWFNSKQILAWAVKQQKVSKWGKVKLLGLTMLKQNMWLYKRLKMLPILRARVYGGGFFLFADCAKDPNKYEHVGAGILTEDGHCTYSPDEKWILMDTYSDVHNLRHVLLYNSKAKRCIGIGSFFSPPTLTKELRCDLHPRWSRDGKQICIDSTHEGSRQMYVLDVSSVVI